MHNTIVSVEGARPEIGRRGDLGDKVGFADPRALFVREDDGDGVAGRGA